MSVRSSDHRAPSSISASTCAALALALALAGVGGLGCADDATASSSSASATSSTTGGATSSGGAGSGATGSGGGGGGGGGTLVGCGGSGTPTAPMPLISRNVPAFASDGFGAETANDDAPNTSWSSDSTPAWLAYDLSGVPEAMRQQVLVSWYAIHAPCYIDDGSPTSGQRPVSYVIEANDAPGGASAPTDGWASLLSIDKGRYCGRQHLVDMKGANWIRMNVTESSADSRSVAFELDVQSAPEGACDAWLFMGDSITYMTMTHAFCNLPELVHEAKPDYFPAVLDAALGGTNTVTATAVLGDTMKDFPGRFVVLAYGTNDHADDFRMEQLVTEVIAAGKLPVVPHMPWSDGSTDGPAINQTIDALYAKYPEIVPGPDLWSFFEGKTDLIPPGDVHPNGEGQEELRKQWALTIESLDE